MFIKEMPREAIPDLQLVKTVVRITEKFASTKHVKFATGFFFHFENELYLVTNRHVVYNEDDTKRPVALTLLLNRKDGLTKNEDGTKTVDLTKHEEYELNLYNDGKSIWFEHPDNLNFPQEKDQVDIAVIPLNKKEVLDRFLITCFDVDSLPDNSLPIIYGESLMVMGYPLGRFDDINNLPIVRNGTMATAFSAYYRGRPIFLIDSRLHEGVSGSPVLTNPCIPKFIDGAWNLPNASKGHSLPMPRLLGIVSNYLTEMDPRTKEYIGLSEIFRATLIPQIIAHHKR